MHVTVYYNILRKQIANMELKKTVKMKCEHEVCFGPKV